MPERNLIIYTDGGARGNPGPAGAGAVLIEDKKIIKEISQYLGEATNNQAEYQALILALEAARDLSATHLEIRMDSELLVRQCEGRYKVRNVELAKLYLKVHNLLTQFVKARFVHVPREQNTQADRFVNKAIDNHR